MPSWRAASVTVSVSVAPDRRSSSSATRAGSPSPGQRGNGDRRRALAGGGLRQQMLARVGVEQVDLVPDLDDVAGVAGVDAEIGQDALDVVGLGRRVGIAKCRAHG